MNPERKRKPHSSPSRGASGAATEAVEAPAASAPEPALTPDPPRRNLPLLLVSIVLLAVWLAVLVWLAATA